MEVTLGELLHEIPSNFQQNFQKNFIYLFLELNIFLYQMQKLSIRQVKQICMVKFIQLTGGLSQKSKFLIKWPQSPFSVHDNSLSLLKCSWFLFSGHYCQEFKNRWLISSSLLLETGRLRFRKCRPDLSWEFSGTVLEARPEAQAEENLPEG